MLESSPLLPTARPRSRPPARRLPHSRRSLLPIAPEIHSPVASSIAEHSRISARPPRHTGPEGTHPASESQSQARARLPIRLVVHWPQPYPVLCCPIRSIVWPSFRLRLCAHPGRQQAPGLGTVPEPDSGLRAARTTRHDRRRIHPHEHRTASHGTAPHLLPDGHNGQPVALAPPARRPFLVPSAALAIPISTPCLTRQRSAFCAHLITGELHISSPSRCLARSIWHFPPDAHRNPCHLSQCSFNHGWELHCRCRCQHAGQRPCRQHQPLPVCRLPEEILSPGAPPATHSHPHAGETLYM